MQELVAALKSSNMTIGTCESLTAGMFASRLADIAGVSSVLKGGFVTYWNECKINVVYVSEKTIDEFGVVSKQTAIEMAEKSRLLLACDCCISFTGNAGPDVLEGKPAGLVYSAVAFKNVSYVYELQLHGERNEIRSRVCDCMSQILLMHIQGCGTDYSVIQQNIIKALGITDYSAYIKSVKEQNHG